MDLTFSVIAEPEHPGEGVFSFLVLLLGEMRYAADRQDGQVVGFFGEEGVREREDFVVLFPAQQDAAELVEYGFVVRTPGESAAVVPFCGIPPLQLVEGISDQRKHLRDGVSLQDITPEADDRLILPAAVQQAHQAEFVEQFVRHQF